ncbi:hypothetical protein UYSO10_4452 [Kosakonia radicincitans]|nr:hypothetical protein UYSO10_4452 [Kosakonia radicincitans]
MRDFCHTGRWVRNAGSALYVHSCAQGIQMCTKSHFFPFACSLAI